MFRKFFNPDNALMITMTQITDCIFLSIVQGRKGCADGDHRNTAQQPEDA